MPLKTQDNSNMDDPSEHFQWALGTVPGIGQSPMAIPAQMTAALSKHLWECGFRHHPELQEKKMLRPYRGQQTNFNTSSRWVPMDTVEPEPIRIPDINALTVHEREALLAQYRDAGMIPEAAPAPNVAYVVGEQ